MRHDRFLADLLLRHEDADGEAGLKRLAAQLGARVDDDVHGAGIAADTCGRELVDRPRNRDRDRGAEVLSVAA